MLEPMIPRVDSLPQLRPHLQAVVVWADEIRDVSAIQRKLDGIAALRRWYEDKEIRDAMQNTLRRLEIRIGELLGPKRQGSRSDLSAADKFEFPRQRAEEFRQLAAHREEIVPFLDQADAENRGVTRAEVLRRVTPMSGDYEWYTPELYVEAARKVMGSIDVDPASSKEANKLIKAKRYYDEKTNGLDYPWPGNVWLNPPYRMPDVRHFVDNLLADYPRVCKQAILLTHNSTDTKWWQEAAKRAACICFTKGRIDFINANDKSSTSPRQGQTFMYFGNKSKVFKEVFDNFGIILSDY